MVKTRVITALLMLVVVAGMLFFANAQVWLVGISALVAWAAVEWASLAKFSKLGKTVFAFTVPVLLGAGYTLMNHGDARVVMFGVLLGVLFWLMMVPVWLFNAWHVRSKFVMALVGVLVLLSAGWCLLLVRPHPFVFPPTKAQPWVLLGLLLVVWVADTVAFFAGRAFGRHKLAPSISPGKTIEGALGAWVGVSAYLIFLKYMDWLPFDLTLAKLFLLAFMMTYISILGDLFESWGKRCEVVKDSGRALPGHGGILDRIDAILSTLPLPVLLFYLLSAGQ